MGLVMIAWIILCGTLSWFIYVEKDEGWGIHILWAILLIFVAIPIAFSHPPISDYSKMAEVSIDDETTQIFFNEFEQHGNIITIDEYATRNLHWTDFKFIEVYQDLNIALLDNDDKFIYTDRETKETYNENKVATQP
jgi:hypothetical protein